eukprot:g3813.t1
MRYLTLLITFVCILSCRIPLHSFAEYVKNEECQNNELNQNGDETLTATNVPSQSCPSSHQFQNPAAEFTNNEVEITEDAVLNGAFPCSMSQSMIQKIYDGAQGVWTVDDEVMGQLKTDLQKLVNCTKKDDIIRFQTTGPIQPNAPIIIPWNLTLSSNDESVTKTDGANPVLIFTCPRIGGVLEVRTSSFTIAGARFENCRNTGNVISVVSTKCDETTRTTGRINFRNVQFTNNVLSNNQRILAVQTPSCVELEFENIAIRENQCAEESCFLLLSKNTLSRIAVDGNRGTEGSVLHQAVFSVPPESHTNAVDVIATNNRIRIFHVTSSRLTLSSSQFQGNVPLYSATLDADTDGGVLQSQNATVSIHDCSFAFNAGENGGVAFLQWSDVEFVNCAFSTNSAVSGQGGALYINASTVEFVNCSFSKNEAIQNGGAICALFSVLSLHNLQFTANYALGSGTVFMNESTASMDHISFTNNTVEWYGGGLDTIRSSLSLQTVHVEANSGGSGSGLSFRYQSDANLTNCVLVRNSARYYGALHSYESSQLKIERTVFDSNIANGGTGLYLVAESHAAVHECTFHANFARYIGGAIFVRFDASLIVTKSNFTNNIVQVENGGAVFGETANISIFNSSFDANEARNGGCLFIAESDVQIANCYFVNCRASVNGGGVSLENSNVNFTNNELRLNQAVNGSAIHSELSVLLFDTVNITSSYSSHTGTVCLRNSSAGFNQVVFDENLVEWFGGAVDTIRSTVNLQYCNFINSSAGAGPGLSLRYQTQANISDCVFQSNSARFYGAIHTNEQSRVTLKGVRFLNNTSNGGSGLYLVTGTIAEVENCEFRGNFARYAGGAIFARFSARLFIKRSSFLENSAEVYQGGAIYSETSEIFMNDSILDSNTGNEGGSLYVAHAETEIVNCVFRRNKAVENGGGMYLKSAKVKLTQTELHSNAARIDGGAIYATNDAQLIGVNLTVSGNDAKERGGGFALISGTTHDCQFCTFQDNEAETGSDVFDESKDVDVVSSTPSM